MKIKSLCLENWRWHRSFTMENIQWFTMITGPNACGKSSILEALTWLLCGATKHTSVDGKGADVLVMDGEGRALVEAEVETEDGETHTLKRSIPHALSIDGATGGVKRTTELLKAIMAPVTPESLLTCFESMRILQMGDQERKKFFGRVLGIEQRRGIEEIHALINTWLPTIGVQADSNSANQVHATLNSLLVPNDLSWFLSDIHKLLQEKRRELNGLIDAAKIAISGSTVDNSTEDIPSQDILMRRKVTLEAELALSISKEVKPGDSIGVVLVKPDIAKIEGKIKNLESIIAKTTELLAPVKARFAIYESQAGQIGSAAKQCPFFVKVCPLSADEVSAALSDIESRLSSDRRIIVAHEKRIASAEAELLRSRAEMLRAQEEIAKYEKLWSGQDQVTMGKIRPQEEVKADILIVDGLIKRSMERAVNEELRRRNSDLVQRASVAEAELGRVQTLIDAFSPSGITSQILTTHMRRLEELATDASRLITGGRYEIGFSMADGDLDAFVISDGKKRPINTLSTSEEIWVSLVISHVINRYIGNKILLIDEASILDEEMVSGLASFILSSGEWYSNIFLCATVPDDQDFLQRVRETLGEAFRRIIVRR